jgi:hypothetical protein
VQCALQVAAITEIDSQNWYRTQGLPAGFEVVVDKLGKLFIREHHGSRYTSVCSTKFLVESAQHLKQNDWLTRALCCCASIFE